jgi:hypothetical protein
MYIEEWYVFGINLNKNLELKKIISDAEIEFSKEIVNNYYEINAPYHGGCYDWDDCPYIFGTIIDDKGDLLSTIKSTKKEDYLDGFNEFIQEFKMSLKNMNYYDKNNIKDFDNFKKQNDRLEKIKSMIDNIEPDFYLLEVSS